MDDTQTGQGWHPGAQIAVGTDLEGRHVLVGLQGQAGSLIRLKPEQAQALATALRATARRVGRRCSGREDEDE